MGIIKVYSNDTAGKQEHLKDQVEARFTNLFNNLKSNFLSNMQLMWTDDSASGGLSVQQKFDAFGGDAAKLFGIALATATMLNTIQPGAVDPTPPLAYTINPDGSVTL